MADSIKITIVWTGGDIAALVDMHDGGWPVPIADNHPNGRGSIVVEYEGPVTGAHVIAIGLAFPGTTLTGLKATGSVNGGAEREIDSSKSETDKWKGWGVIV